MGCAASSVALQHYYSTLPYFYLQAVTFTNTVTCGRIRHPTPAAQAHYILNSTTLQGTPLRHDDRGGDGESDDGRPSQLLVDLLRTHSAQRLAHFDSRVHLAASAVKLGIHIWIPHWLVGAVLSHALASPVFQDQDA